MFKVLICNLWYVQAIRRQKEAINLTCGAEMSLNSRRL